MSEEWRQGRDCQKSEMHTNQRREGWWNEELNKKEESYDVFKPLTPSACIIMWYCCYLNIIYYLYFSTVVLLGRLQHWDSRSSKVEYNILFLRFKCFPGSQSFLSFHLSMHVCWVCSCFFFHHHHLHVVVVFHAFWKMHLNVSGSEKHQRDEGTTLGVTLLLQCIFLS